MSFIVPFPGGQVPVSLSLANTINSALSGIFSLPVSKRMVVLCFAAQTSPPSGVTNCTIGGHAATQIVNNGSTTNTCSIWAAMIDPATDPNTWAVSGISVFSGRCTAFIYQSTATGISVAASAVGTGANPTATLSVPDNSSYLGCAKAQGASSPGVAWSLLTLDSTQSFSQQSDTCAHKNYTAGVVGQVATCTFSGSSGSAGVFAVFSP